MNSSLLLIVDEAIGLVMRFFNCFEQTYIHKRQARIRKINIQKYAAQQELQETFHDLSEARRHYRHQRRGAIIKYRRAQRDLIQVALHSLREAKSVSYTRLKTVQNRINNKSGMSRSYIDPDLFSEFHQLKDALHAEIAESKWLTMWLEERLSHVRGELQTLHDSKTHNKIGGKKDVLALLAELHRDGRRRMASKEAKESVLTLSSFSYVLESQCRHCRAWLSRAMSFCPLCGHSQRREEKARRFLKKDAVLGASCNHCRAPTADEFSYCFNCGERHDPFGLRSVV